MSRYSGLTKIAYAKSAAVEKTAQQPSVPIEVQRIFQSDGPPSQKDRDLIAAWRQSLPEGYGFTVGRDRQMRLVPPPGGGYKNYDNYSKFTNHVKSMDDMVQNSGGFLSYALPWLAPGYMSAVSAADAEIARSEGRDTAAKWHTGLAALGVAGPIGQAVKGLNVGPAAFAANKPAGWLTRSGRWLSSNGAHKSGDRILRAGQWGDRTSSSVSKLWKRPVGNALYAVGHAGGAGGNVNRFTRVANKAVKPFERLTGSKLYSKIPSYETTWYGTQFVEDVRNGLSPQYPEGVYYDLPAYLDATASQNYAAADPGSNRVDRGQSELLQSQPSRVDMTPTNLPPSPAVVQNQPSAPIAAPNPRNASLFQRQPSRAEMMPPGL